MRARHRRVLEQVALAVADEAVQPILPVVHAGKDGCGGQELEGAAERESLVRAVAESLSAFGVEDGDAEPAT